MINAKFIIEKLSINFLADVESPCQDIAELCFNEYELSIIKNQKNVKIFDMSLKSLSLIDKLRVSSQSNTESKLNLTELDNNVNYLLKSNSSSKNKF